MLASAAFLPLTLTVIERWPDRRPVLGVVRGAVRRAELDSCAVWQSLIGDYDCAARAELLVGLRRLSLLVGVVAGDHWWNGDGHAHRDRVAGYQRWLEESLAESDGAGFAEAFAGYDEALARAVVCSDVVNADLVNAKPPRGPVGRPARTPAVRSGTMAGWARQARALTSRVTSRAAQPALHRAMSPLRWATSKRGTSSSRWSRRSRSAG
ncbi:MAG: hypothetical protein M3Z25_13045 [Actinomycetota bacterium]|nr:hypothetical protein [Actinomycetota bacterium]